MKTIEILVSPTGETVIQTKGFSGASCRQASKALEAALGVKQSDKPTTEMFEAHTKVDQPLNQGNG
jgi:hypothetical protein